MLAIAAHHFTPIGVAVANTRLVVLSGAVWDRAEGRFVALGTLPALEGSSLPSLQIAMGNFLKVAHSLTPDWQSPFQVSVYDSTRLAVLAS